MPQLTPKQIKALNKLAKIKEDKDTATVESFLDLEDKVESISEKVDLISQKTDERLSELSEELKKKLESELVLEIDRDELKGDRGDDGEDYVLTDKDKEDIAKSIKVPIVEKIIEKTEVIKELPIITNEIKEVAIPETAEDTRNKLEALQGEDRLAFGAIRESDTILKDIKELKEKPPQVIETRIEGMGGSGGIDILEDGSNRKQGATKINFGAGFDVTPTANGVSITTDQTEEVVDYIQFNTTATPQPSAPGLIQWNATDGTYDMGLLNSSVLQVGQEMMFFGKASGAIANGDVCQFAGVQGDHILIKKAVGSEIEANPHFLVGVATENIANGNFGYVTWFGKVNNVYTKTPANQDTSNWTAGDILYFNITTGQMTKTMPAVPNRIITIAAVIKEQTGSSESGTIIVRPLIGTKLQDLDDVDGTPLTATGQIPVWDNTGKYFDFNYNIGDFLKTDQTTPQITVGTFTFPKVVVGDSTLVSQGVILNDTSYAINVTGQIHSTPPGTGNGYFDTTFYDSNASKYISVQADTSANGNIAGRFKNSSSSLLVDLVDGTYAINATGTSKFNNLLGGVQFDIDIASGGASGAATFNSKNPLFPTSNLTVSLARWYDGIAGRFTDSGGRIVDIGTSSNSINAQGKVTVTDYAGDILVQIADSYGIHITNYNSNQAGWFENNAGYNADLGGNTYSGYFHKNSGASVYLADNSYAINAYGDNSFTGGISSFGAGFQGSGQGAAIGSIVNAGDIGSSSTITGYFQYDATSYRAELATDKFGGRFQYGNSANYPYAELASSLYGVYGWGGTSSSMIAGRFQDDQNHTVDLCDRMYAINATGPTYLQGYLGSDWPLSINTNCGHAIIFSYNNPGFEDHYITSDSQFDYTKELRFGSYGSYGAYPYYRFCEDDYNGYAAQILIGDSVTTSMGGSLNIYSTKTTYAISANGESIFSTPVSGGRAYLAQLNLAAQFDTNGGYSGYVRIMDNGAGLGTNGMALYVSGDTGVSSSVSKFEDSSQVGGNYVELVSSSYALNVFGTSQFVEVGNDSYNVTASFGQSAGSRYHAGIFDSGEGFSANLGNQNTSGNVSGGSAATFDDGIGNSVTLCDISYALKSVGNILLQGSNIDIYDASGMYNTISFYPVDGSAVFGKDNSSYKVSISNGDGSGCAVNAIGTGYFKSTSSSPITEATMITAPGTSAGAAVEGRILDSLPNYYFTGRLGFGYANDPDEGNVYTFNAGWFSGYDNGSGTVDKVKLGYLNNSTGEHYAIKAIGDIKSTSIYTSSLNVSGSIAGAYRAITALRTLDETDYQIDCTANSFTVTLPTSVGVTGRIYSIKNSGTGIITLATTSSETIDGVTTQSLVQWDSLMVMSTGSNWIVV